MSEKPPSEIQETDAPECQVFHALENLFWFFRFCLETTATETQIFFRYLSWKIPFRKTDFCGQLESLFGGELVFYIRYLATGL